MPDNFVAAGRRLDANARPPAAGEARELRDRVNEASEVIALPWELVQPKPGNRTSSRLLLQSRRGAPTRPFSFTQGFPGSGNASKKSSEISAPEVQETRFRRGAIHVKSMKRRAGRSRGIKRSVARF
jgi:hypothetical protein